MKADAKLRFRTYLVEDAGASKISGANWGDEKDKTEFKFPSLAFRHIGDGVDECVGVRDE